MAWGLQLWFLPCVFIIKWVVDWREGTVRFVFEAFWGTRSGITEDLVRGCEMCENRALLCQPSLEACMGSGQKKVHLWSALYALCVAKAVVCCCRAWFTRHVAVSAAAPLASNAPLVPPPLVDDPRSSLAGVCSDSSLWNDEPRPASFLPSVGHSGQVPAFKFFKIETDFPFLLWSRPLALHHLHNINSNFLPWHWIDHPYPSDVHIHACIPCTW